MTGTCRPDRHTERKKNGTSRQTNPKYLKEEGATETGEQALNRKLTK